MASLQDYKQALRPTHWVKNIFVFAGLVFGRRLSGSVDQALSALGQAVGGFVAFCAASSAVYIFNDIIDIALDRAHPLKRHRPIASGRIRPRKGYVLAGLLGLGAIGLGAAIGPVLGAVVAGYMAIMILYTLLLRRVMIVDCMVIAVGFCLRAIAGALAVRVVISPWLVICTFALSLFIAFGKRRAEVCQLGADGHNYRSVLAGYTPELLGHMLDVTSGIAVICFLLYAMDPRTAQLFGSHWIVYTVPLVLYCVFRFSSAMQAGLYPGPVEFMLTDLPFQVGVLAWAGLCILIVYAGPAIRLWLFG